MKKLLVVAMCLVPVLAAAQSANDSGRKPASTFQGFKEGAAAVTLWTTAGTGSLTGSEPVETPRIYRSGVIGDVCAEFGSGNYQYQLVPFTSNSTGSLTVTFDPGSCGVDIFPTFHDAPFNPTNVCTGYKWSYGSSVAFTSTFPVTPNKSMVMVVTGVNNAPTVVCGPYTYSIFGTTNIIPTMPQWAMIVTSLLLAISGIWMVRRRRNLSKV